MTDYAYEQSGRRPMTFFAAAILIALLWTAHTYSAPIIIWVIWLLVAAGLLCLLIANPKSGMSLTKDSFKYWIDEEDVETIPLKMITHFEIIDWSDSTDFYVHLNNGRRDSIFSGCVPSSRKFETIISERGIKVIRT